MSLVAHYDAKTRVYDERWRQFFFLVAFFPPFLLLLFFVHTRLVCCEFVFVLLLSNTFAFSSSSFPI